MSDHSIFWEIFIDFLNFTVVYISYISAKFLVKLSLENEKGKTTTLRKILFIPELMIIPLIIAYLGSDLNHLSIEKGEVYFTLSVIPTMMGLIKGLKIYSKSL